MAIVLDSSQVCALGACLLRTLHCSALRRPQRLVINVSGDCVSIAGALCPHSRVVDAYASLMRRISCQQPTFHSSGRRKRSRFAYVQQGGSAPFETPFRRAQDVFVNGRGATEAASGDFGGDPRPTQKTQVLYGPRPPWSVLRPGSAAQAGQGRVGRGRCPLGPPAKASQGFPGWGSQGGLPPYQY